MVKKRAHFIGIAGMGMSAVAILLKEQGWHVSGSDAEMYPPATTQLKRHKITYKTSYNPANIPRDADLIVIGMNAKLTDENPEVRAARDAGIRIASFPEIIGEITKDREVIVVAGSYGKSTTTALLAWILKSSGVDAGWFIGASPHGMEPAHLGKHPVFVVEGDEYPTAHIDLRAKFEHYAVHDALITAATHDHVNIYNTQEDFLKPFEILAAKLPPSALLVLSDEPYASGLKKHTHARVVTYGAGEWHAENVVHGDRTTFDLVHEATLVAQISTLLLGAHNVQNIVGASSMLLEKKLVSPPELVAAIETFEGLARRLDKKTKRSAAPAFEGFGSSREKLRAAIAALKAQYPDRRLVVVFEPHTFSWRNSNMLHWFDTAFEGAALVVLYKPAEQGAATHEQSTQQEMAERLSSAGIAVVAATDPEKVMSTLKSEIRKSDVVLLSSSGAMDGLIERIPEWLDNAFV